MKIVRAGLAHADDIGYVHAASWHTAYKGIVPDEFLSNFTPENRSAVFRRVIPTRPEEFYIAYVDDKPAGMVILGGSNGSDADDLTGEIGALYFLPDYWGKGYGRRLMDFAVGRLKELGFEKVSLWVLEDNLRARRFYEKYGYTWDGTKKEINLGRPLVEMRYILRL